MRKALETASILGLVALAWMTIAALAGPHRLPSRVPTHFDVTGQPTGWGSPWMLLTLPIVACGLYFLMTLVARYPSTFNYPVRVTQANRQRLQDLALGMIAWLKAEVVWLMACVQMVTVRAARLGWGGVPVWLMPLALGAVFGTIIGHVVAMRRSA
jgi:Protein of unknown function (DUF1648)